MPMRDRSRAAVSRQTLVGLRSVALGAGGCAGRHQRTFLPRQRRKRGQRSPGPPPALSRPPSRTEHPSRRRASRRWAACQCGNRRALPARAPWTGLERCRCRRSTHPAPLPPASRRATCPTNTTKGGPGRLQRPHERAANQIGGFGLQAYVLARASGLLLLLCEVSASSSTVFHLRADMSAALYVGRITPLGWSGAAPNVRNSRRSASRRAALIFGMAGRNADRILHRATEVASSSWVHFLSRSERSS